MNAARRWGMASSTGILGKLGPLLRQSPKLGSADPLAPCNLERNEDLKKSKETTTSSSFIETQWAVIRLTY
jgi:hypothetical protein